MTRGPHCMVPEAPWATVVVASNGARDALDGCLAALEGQADGAEVLVFPRPDDPASLPARHPWAVWMAPGDRLVPEMWRDGIDRARGDVVAITISAMVPDRDWLQTIRDEATPGRAIAGAIDPGDGLGLADWGEYFCRYARDMAPFPAHETPDLPGDNAAYRREHLERRRDLFRDGFWEPVVHRGLQDDGVQLWQLPQLVVRQGPSAGFRAFTHQRLVHGRAHGGQRAVHFGRARNLVGVLAAPLVPIVLTARILGEVRAKRRHRVQALRALPVIVWFNIVWALGEARGHAQALVAR